jgi:hypothetical protein
MFNVEVDMFTYCFNSTVSLTVQSHCQISCQACVACHRKGLDNAFVELLVRGYYLS